MRGVANSLLMQDFNFTARPDPVPPSGSNDTSTTCLSGFVTGITLLVHCHKVVVCTLMIEAAFVVRV